MLIGVCGLWLLSCVVMVVLFGYVFMLVCVSVCYGNSGLGLILCCGVMLLCLIICVGVIL